MTRARAMRREARARGVTVDELVADAAERWRRTVERLELERSTVEALG